MAEPRSRVSNGQLMAEIEAVKDVLKSHASDVREARDAALGMATTWETADVKGQLTEIRREIREAVSGVKTDLERQVSDVRSKVDGHEGRLTKLEGARAKADGVHGLLGRFASVLPQFLSALAGAGLAVMTVLGFRPHH